jgi:hypothetical protein
MALVAIRNPIIVRGAKMSSPHFGMAPKAMTVIKKDA